MSQLCTSTGSLLLRTPFQKELPARMRRVCLADSRASFSFQWKVHSSWNSPRPITEQSSRARACTSVQKGGTLRRTVFALELPIPQEETPSRLCGRLAVPLANLCASHFLSQMFPARLLFIQLSLRFTDMCHMTRIPWRCCLKNMLQSEVPWWNA